MMRVEEQSVTELHVASKGAHESRIVAFRPWECPEGPQITYAICSQSRDP
jgi:hypothetical protein